MPITFNTTILQAEGKNATGLRIPPEVVAELGGGKKPAVKITINGYVYRSTMAAYAGDVYMLPFSSEHRAATGLKAGDPVEVTLELDTEPRTVEIPAALAEALAAKPGATAAFEALSPSRRKEAVRQVNETKNEETRARRIAGIVEKLGD